MANVVLNRGRSVFSIFSARASYSGIRRNYASNESKQTIFQKLWDMGIYSPINDAYSKTLTANAACYELVFERVKPEFMSDYLEETNKVHTSLSKNADQGRQLIGSWTTLYGNCNEAVHLWVYKDGYKGVSNYNKNLKENQELQDHFKKKGTWLQSQRNQLLHEFSFWGEPKSLKSSHIYELRSYDLKPGTLIEWGNKWGQAINIRRKDAVGGFFSQIGDLYQVHHIWAYNDLEHRKTERERMWQDPGWDDCVAATVPLIRHMKSCLLQPIDSSPMQ